MNPEIINRNWRAAKYLAKIRPDLYRLGLYNKDVALFILEEDIVGSDWALFDIVVPAKESDE